MSVVRACFLALGLLAAPLSALRFFELPGDLPPPPSRRGGSGKSFSTHLRYEKSTSVPSARRIWIVHADYTPTVSCT